MSCQNKVKYDVINSTLSMKMIEKIKRMRVMLKKYKTILTTDHDDSSGSDDDSWLDDEQWYCEKVTPSIQKPERIERKNVKKED